MFEVFLVIAYFCGWSATIYLRNKVFGPAKSSTQSMDRATGHLLFGAIWPIYVPIFLTFMVGTGRIRPKKIPKLFKDVDKPSTTLAHLIASKMLQNLDNFTNKKWSWKNIVVYAELPEWSTYSNSGRRIEIVTINGARFLFSKEELEILDKAAWKAYSLHIEKKNNEIIYFHQMKALDVIEDMLINGSEQNTR